MSYAREKVSEKMEHRVRIELTYLVWKTSA